MKSQIILKKVIMGWAMSPFILSLRLATQEINTTLPAVIAYLKIIQFI